MTAALPPDYVLIRSRRRSLALIVRADDTLEVRSPPTLPKWRIEQFIREKSGWIDRKRRENKALIPVCQIAADQVPRADCLIRERIVFLTRRHLLPVPGKIIIRDLVSRWGSCSKAGTISINRRCAWLPEALLDYVILHELCHLSQLNHGPQFWQLLSRYLPDAPARRRLLRRYHLVALRAEGIPS